MDLLEYKGLDWLATVLTATSLFFLAKQRKKGFLFGIIGNLLWIAFGIMAGSAGSVIASGIYIGFQIHGWKEWKENPPQGKKINRRNRAAESGAPSPK
jgi:nicotinamide riboside transporter PnuC